MCSSDLVTDSALPVLLHLRLIVGFLGEKSQFGWWSTTFFDPFSRRSLEFVAPRSVHLMQYHSVVEAARLVHDHGLNAGSYHLFRLQEIVQEDLHGLMRGAHGSDLVAQLPTDREAGLAELKVISADKGTHSVGPFSVGSIDDLLKLETLKTIAGGYVFAFEGSIKTYPYLAG